MEAGSFKSACLKALETGLDVLRKRFEGAGQKPKAAIIDEALVHVGVLSRDLALLHAVICEDDRVVSSIKYVGAVSRAQALGGEAYNAFLEALLGSEVGLGSGVFRVAPHDGILTLDMAYTSCEVSRLLGSGSEGLEERLDRLVEALLFAEALVSRWVVEALEALGRGEKIAPFNLKEMIEKFFES